MVHVTRRGGVLAIALLPLFLLMAGCATPDESIWQMHYDRLSEEDIEPTERAQVEQVPFEQLESGDPPEGFIVVGRSAFRDEALEGEDRDADSALARHGERVGADLVRWAQQPAGQETRVRYVRQRTVGRAPDTGAVGRRDDGTTSELVPIEVEVNVYDYMAVFYRRIVEDN